MSWTLCTSGAAMIKAGANCNSNVISGAYTFPSLSLTGAAILAEWSNECEGTLCSKTRYDWVANYGSVGANFKPILADVTSDMIAIKIINFDMSNYTSRLEAQTMIDVMDSNVKKIVDFLLDDKNKAIVGAST